MTLANAGNELPLPGYPAAIDRIARNAVDVLVGDPVDPGTSLLRLLSVVRPGRLRLADRRCMDDSCGRARALRARRTHRAGSCRRHRRASPRARSCGLVLLVALPALTLGWQHVARSGSPTCRPSIVLMGALLLVTAALRLGPLLRRAARTPHEEARRPGTGGPMAATGHRGRSRNA